MEPLRSLRLISLLDLSGNRIKFVPNNAFVTLRLKTLKLGCNSIDIWNLRLELGCKLRQGLRTRLGTRFLALGLRH